MSCAADIRKAQLAAVEDVERQLRDGSERITMADGSTSSREAAWAATSAIRMCWENGWAYDGQTRDDSGDWTARGVEAGTPRAIGIGRFPG